MTISEMSARTMTEACNPSSRAIGSFLVEYTAWLMGCGATCIRIEKNVGRIAASYGVRTEMTVMPRHIQLSVMDREDMECITLNVAVKAVPIDFSLNTSLVLQIVRRRCRRHGHSRCCHIGGLHA